MEQTIVTIYEDDTYILRNASTLEEIRALEEVLVDGELRVSHVYCIGATKAAVLKNYEATREKEKHQRFGVYMKSTGEVLAGIQFCRMSDYSPFSDVPDKNAEDAVYSGFFDELEKYDDQVHEKYPEYFSDPTKVAYIDLFAVARAHTGKGLCSLMHRAALKYSKDSLMCDYICAMMHKISTFLDGDLYFITIIIQNTYLVNNIK